jgi:hypothetical protein
MDLQIIAQLVAKHVYATDPGERTTGSLEPVVHIEPVGQVGEPEEKYVKKKW